MKIELEEETDLTFGDVKPGEVFIAKSGFTYLKIRDVPNTKVNAIFVCNGDWNIFEHEVPITRIVKTAVLREE